MSTTIGTIQSLAIRPSRHTPPLRVDAVHALAGLGLGGDVHADYRSPRQVLLAGAGVYDDHALPAHALRENLLVDLDTDKLASGTVLQIGRDVQLRLMFQCESCGQLDAQRPGLARALAGRRGMLARVLAGGTIRPGDRIRDLGPLLPAWSDDWRDRVLRILDAVPAQSVVEYGLLARLAGVQSTYCRAFPGMLAKLGPAYATRAVSMRAPAPGMRWNGDGLFDAGLAFGDDRSGVQDASCSA
jgi:hypothetical protein